MAGRPRLNQDETAEPIEKETKIEARADVATPQTMILKSELDAYVSERLREQPATIDDIQVKFNAERAEKHNILALPKELEKYGKNYAFRWINKKKRSIDNALDVIGWTFVTLNYFKDLPKHLFTSNGVIERGDAIMAFMPIKQAESIRLRPAQLSRERVRSAPVQNLRKWEDRGEKYYKPDLGAAENDNEKPRGIAITPDSNQE